MESARTDRLCRSSAMGIGRSKFNCFCGLPGMGGFLCWWGRLRRSWCLDGCVNSDKAPLTVEERAVNLLAPANIPSSEKIYYRKPQLRREPRSPEESTTSDKGCPSRSRRAHDIATSAESLFVGGQPPHPPPAPASIRSQEDSILPERLLRRKARLPEQAFIHRDVSALAFRSYHVIIQFKHRNVTRMGHNLNLFREFLGMSLGIFLF